MPRKLPMKLATAAWLLAFSCSVPAAEPATAKKLEMLGVLQATLEYGHMLEEVFLRNCRAENPDVEAQIARHRALDQDELPRVQALIGKYRTRLRRELGAEAADLAIASLAKKQVELKQTMAASVAKDEKPRNFDCVNDPGRLPGLPEEVTAGLRQMERE